ncbi:MAG: hypothetical protein M1828_004918 [Chrysothrix sp. TS-e1954]|nr:MAG: hypothetical protein M1828_004918 [Chrysothrix sp. TS-e1954]
MAKRKRPNPPPRPSHPSKHARASTFAPGQKASPKNTSTTSAPPNPSQSRPPSTIPSGSILLVGEGDFSFSRALLSRHLAQQPHTKHPQPPSSEDELSSEANHSDDPTSNPPDTRPRSTSHPPTHIHATTPDSPTDATSKHAHATSNITYLTTHAAHVTHNIDARRLSSYASLRLGSRRRRRGRRKDAHDPAGNDRDLRRGQQSGYDWVIFQFPHVGGLSTDVRRQVRANQELLSAFLRSARGLLKRSSARSSAALGGTLDEEEVGGKILVTLFEGMPYEMWNIRDLARHAGLVVLRSERFDGEGWKGWGYRHARTFGDVRARAREGGGVGVGGAREGDGEDGWEGFSGADDGDLDGQVSGERVSEEDGEGSGGESRRPGRWRGEERPARSYIFGLKMEDRGTEQLGRMASQKGKKAKRNKREHDSDED